MPRVSAVIAAYNNAAYLPETLDSILAQTVGDLEVVVVDDASSDDTPDRTAPYAGRIVYHRLSRNRGSAAAWNEAIRRSTGAFVALAAADDPWLPDRLERQLAVFGARPECGLVYGRMVSVDEARRPLRRRSGERPPLPEGWVFRELFMQENFISPTALVRREVIDRVGLLDEEFRVAQDYEWYLRIAAVCPVGCVDAVLVEYRKHAGSVTTGKRHRAFPYQRKAIEKIRRLHPDLVDRRLYDARRLLQYRKEARYYLRHGDPERARACLREALALGLARPGTLWRYLGSYVPGRGRGEAASSAPPAPEPLAGDAPDADRR
jgi:glycosyltransferase involved in cell wall biosynthesis